MSSDFYCDVYSNSSLDIFTDNTVASFTTKLDQPIELHGEFECALAQLVCPSTTNTSSAKNTIVLSCLPEDNEQRTKGVVRTKTTPFNDASTLKTSYKAQPSTRNLAVPSYTPATGRFLGNKLYSFLHEIPDNPSLLPNGKSVVEYIHRLFTLNESEEDDDVLKKLIVKRNFTNQETSNPLRKNLASFRVDKSTGVLHVYLRDTDVSIAFSGNLARILGFPVSDDQWVIFDQPGEYNLEQNRKVDINSSRPNILCVYTDIILPHIVGDSSAPLLRVITLPLQNSMQGFLSFNFETLHYLPVALKSFQELSVQVRDARGILVPFQEGILYLRLHFRPRRRQ